MTQYQLLKLKLVRFFQQQKMKMMMAFKLSAKICATLLYRKFESFSHTEIHTQTVDSSNSPVPLFSLSHDFLVFFFRWLLDYYSNCLCTYCILVSRKPFRRANESLTSHQRVKSSYAIASTRKKHYYDYFFCTLFTRDKGQHTASMYRFVYVCTL